MLGAVFPEELGGSGYSYVDYAIVMEELARVDPSIALSVAAHVSLCTNHIYMAGSEEQKRRYIPKLASGEWIGSWSLTEPEAGSDAGQARASAVLDGDVLGAERDQDLHHQCARGRRGSGDGGDGPLGVLAWDLGVHH